MGYCSRDEDGGWTYFFTHEEMESIGYNPDSPLMKHLIALAELSKEN